MADNLLDKASILLTPTAYDNGSMLSIKPENGDGDFDFERNSAATRVNAQGLVENVQIISSELVSNGNFSQIGTEEVLNGNFSQEGSELVTNGDFATDSDWNKETGWVIQNGYAESTALNTRSLYQNIGTPVVGKTYKITYTILETNGGNFRFSYGGVSGTIRNSVGTYTEYIIATSSGDSNIYFDALNVMIGSIDNVSVKEVGQNWILSGGATITDNGVRIISDGTYHSATQYNVLIVGKQYKVQYEITENNSGNLKIQTSLGISTIPSNVGVHTVYGEALQTFLAIERNGTCDITITNISVKEVGQDWTFFGEAEFTDDGARIYSSSGGQSYINQSILTSTKKYRLSYEITDSTTGSLKLINVNGLSDYPIPSTVGTHTLDFIANNNTFFIYRNSGATDVTIDNISVKEITDDTNIPRINYEGFSYQDSLGSELIVNGDFATDSDWTKATGWTISGGTANANTVGNYINLRTNSNIIEPGKTYDVSFDVSNYTQGSVRLSFIQSVATTQVSANGTYTARLVASAVGSSQVYIQGINSFVGSIDNVSVKEYLGQEVVPDSGCGVWLLEPQSTNYSLNSEQPSTWHSSGGVIITANAATSPEGIQNSSLVVNDGSSGARYARNFFDFSSGSGLHTVTTSYFIKYYNNQWVRLRSIFFNGSPANNVSTFFDVQNGVLGTVDANHTAKIEDYGNGWYRCSITFDIDKSVDKSGYVQVEAMDGDNSGTFAANGQGYYAYGSQGEEFSYPTSYIPTNGATSTRLQDIANNSGNASLINSTEGVLYAEIEALANDGTSRQISLSDGSNANNKISLRYTSISNEINAFVKSGGSVVFNAIEVLSDITQNNKLALKYKQDDFSLYVNGVQVATDTSGNTPTGLNVLDFDSAIGTLNFYGKVKALAVYKEALTDSELQSLTTI
jgi:hypothetical protein